MHGEQNMTKVETEEVACFFFSFFQFPSLFSVVFLLLCYFFSFFIFILLWEKTVQACLFSSVPNDETRFHSTREVSVIARVSGSRGFKDSIFNFSVFSRLATSSSGNFYSLHWCLYDSGDNFMIIPHQRWNKKHS